MNRVLLVSNRLPVTVTSTRAGRRVEMSSGGLATALREVHTRSGGLWIGWPGPTDALEPSARAEVDEGLAELGAMPVHLSAGEVNMFYEEFANGVLWPVFHYVTGLLPLRVVGWSEYLAVNVRFARAVAEHYRAGDVIWVHDYQLMLVPALLREMIPDARIGFFLHTPFPGPDLFAVLPDREALLGGLMGADVIGFHTAAYRSHFESSVETLLGVTVSNHEVLYDGRPVRVGVFPIGTNMATYAFAVYPTEVAEEVSALRGDGKCRLLVGIDRLDYTKGIPRRLLAFEELLKRRPEWREHVRLVQVAVPSRTGVEVYRRLRNEVEALIERVNSTFGTPGWVPVDCRPWSVSEVQLLALYRAADVMLVTPVRDGMNLVAKEFVASRYDVDGVLVLSEFAGAAAELRDAVLVNPFDIERCAEAYHLALTMPHAERRARMDALRRQVTEHDVHRWAATFLESLGWRSHRG